MRKRMNSAGYWAAATAVLAGGWAAAPARAALLAYDGFSYDDGTSLIGASGGSGWTDNWTDSGASSETASAPGFTYPSLVTAGNKASLAGQGGSNSGNSSFIFRNTTTTFGADGSSVWLSFIGQRTGTKSGTTSNYERVFGLSVFNSAGSERAAFGEVSLDTTDQWGVVAGTINVAGSSYSGAAIDQQTLIVVRIDYGAGNVDDAFMWVNPDLSAGEAGLGAADASRLDVTDLGFSRLRMTAGGSQSNGAILPASGFLDEIRIGETFDDVTPLTVVPEPGALSVLGLGFGLIAVRRRRRR